MLMVREDMWGAFYDGLRTDLTAEAFRCDCYRSEIGRGYENMYFVSGRLNVSVTYFSTFGHVREECGR